MTEPTPEQLSAIISWDCVKEKTTDNPLVQEIWDEWKRIAEGTKE